MIDRNCGFRDVCEKFLFNERKKNIPIRKQKIQKNRHSSERHQMSKIIQSSQMCRLKLTECRRLLTYLRQCMNGPLLFATCALCLCLCIWNVCGLPWRFALALVFDPIQFESDQGFNAWIFCKTQTHWKWKIMRRPASNSMCNVRARVSL